MKIKKKLTLRCGRGCNAHTWFQHLGALTQTLRKVEQTNLIKIYLRGVQCQARDLLYLVEKKNTLQEKFLQNIVRLV